ncbi:alpha/beta hydrolase [Lyngbya confervoides]|uniref:Alpha/beta hydrolase n=1 Tax=Lyngbya confervoides BDU141951 TaxID=1574623 RepID=A0ABD4T224_9CYAN|nr:alpha/beta hydrolase [Lyngbya confervoides]MCM1982483.1 alpha/beta hydrolase [Lyngbya confervoides BDU141951]
MANHGNFRKTGRTSRKAAWVALLGIFLGWSAPAMAAETIVMKYGPIRRSLPIQDLRTLADTGKPSRQLNTYLRLAKQSPESLRAKLTDPMNVNVLTLDSGLNSIPGNLILDEAGKYISPPQEQGRREALRSALVLSAAGDNQVTLVEILENYPTPVVEVEVDRAVATYRQIDGVLNRQRAISPLFDLLQRGVRSFLK